MRTDAGNCFIFIKKDSEVEEEIYSHASFDTNSRFLFLIKELCVCDRKSVRNLRPATEEEKRSQPIIGRMRPLVKKGQPAPEASGVEPDNEDDDLPF